MDGYGPGDSGWRGLRNVSVSCCGVWDECMESVHCLDEEVGATEWEGGIRTVRTPRKISNEGFDD